MIFTCGSGIKADIDSASGNERHVCMKHHRPPMRNAHAILDSTKTAFRQVHASEQPFACIFKKGTSLGVGGQLMRSPACTNQKKHSPRSEFMPVLHRWILKLTASHL